MLPWSRASSICVLTISDISLPWGLAHTASTSIFFPINPFISPHRLWNKVKISHYAIQQLFEIWPRSYFHFHFLPFPCVSCALSQIPHSANTSHLCHGCLGQFSCPVSLPTLAICRVLDDSVLMSHPLWSLLCLSGQKQISRPFFRAITVP